MVMRLNQNLLFEEHIENVDVFLSLSSDDEANIMSALLAKTFGCQEGNGADSTNCLYKSDSRWKY